MKYLLKRSLVMAGLSSKIWPDYPAWPDSIKISGKSSSSQTLKMLIWYTLGKICNYTYTCLHRCRMHSMSEKSQAKLLTVYLYMPSETPFLQLQHHWLSPFAFLTLLSPVLS